MGWSGKVAVCIDRHEDILWKIERRKVAVNLDHHKGVILQDILRWLDTVFQGQYLPSLSINYVAKNNVLEKLPPQLY